MKKQFKLAILSILLLGGTLVSCNSGDNSQQVSNGISISVSGPTSVEVNSTIRLMVTVSNDTERLGYNATSSDVTIATVDSEGIVTGLKPGTVIITISSRKDSTISQEYVIDVVESSIPTLSIVTETPTMVLSNNGGTALFSANIYNPNNFDVKLEWSSKYNKGTFIGNGKTSQQFRPFYAGSEVIELKAYVGPYLLTAEYNFLIKQDYTGWTEISTADELIDLVTNKAGTNNLTSNYYLANDIDLEGYVISPSKRKSSTCDLQSTFDGRGHKISNFVVEGESSSGANGGLFSLIGAKGTVRNLALSCEIGENGSGWGTGTIAASNEGLIENCYFEVNHSYDTGLKADSNGYVPFCAAVTGMIKGTTRDVVVNVLDTVGKSTIYADHAYPVGGYDASTPQTFTVENFYTNHTAIGGQVWDWGYAVLDQTGYTSGIDFSLAKKETYNLNTNIWALNDGEIPTLKVQE